MPANLLWHHDAPLDCITPGDVHLWVLLWLVPGGLIWSGVPGRSFEMLWESYDIVRMILWFAVAYEALEGRRGHSNHPRTTWMNPPVLGKLAWCFQPLKSIANLVYCWNQFYTSFLFRHSCWYFFGKALKQGWQWQILRPIASSSHCCVLSEVNLQRMRFCLGEPSLQKTENCSHLFYFISFYLFIFWCGVLLYSPGWPWIVKHLSPHLTTWALWFVHSHVCKRWDLRGEIPHAAF